MIEEVKQQEEEITKGQIELVVGEDYQSSGTGQKGVLIMADIEADSYEIALANDTHLRKDCLSRGMETNYIWRGGYSDMVNEWLYIGPTIEGYDEIIEEGCCKDKCLNVGGGFSEEEESYAIDAILDIAHYGFTWLKDHPKKDPYRTASIETLAHVIACFITQSLTQEPSPTEEVVQMICDLPDEKELEVRLYSYINTQKDTKNI